MSVLKPAKTSISIRGRMIEVFQAETYEQALIRLTGDFQNLFGAEPLSPEVRAALRREATCALEIAKLPVLHVGKDGRYHCPRQCGKFLSRNYSPTDVEGFSSLNCIVHGWVGKWNGVVG